MELAYIREHWKSKSNTDSEASISAWDSVAEDYADGRVKLEEDTFLQFLQKKVKLEPHMRVLDVGCGAGAYSLALAPEVKEVVGVDFSPKMLEAAQRCADQTGVKNVRFLERDWHHCGGEEFCGRYDLVFAHTTPAIADYKTFLKMMNASRKYCLFCRPARRTDSVLDQLRDTLGIRKESRDAAIPYTFDTIWESGYQPEIQYEETVWRSKKPLREAEKWYLGRLKENCALNQAQEEAVRQHLKSISENGMVSDVTHTTLVTFFWEVSR